MAAVMLVVIGDKSALGFDLIEWNAVAKLSDIKIETNQLGKRNVFNALTNGTSEGSPDSAMGNLHCI